MSTETIMISDARGVLEFLLNERYRYCATLVPDRIDEACLRETGAIYSLAQRDEYLFAEERDELHKALLLWDERSYTVTWHAAAEGETGEGAPGWWEIRRADGGLLPDWVQRSLFPVGSGAPGNETPIDEVACLVRANLCDPARHAVLWVCDRDNAGDVENLREWAEDEKYDKETTYAPGYGV